MPSVADALRRAVRERVATLSPDERLALTARLAEDDLDAFAAAQGLTREEARRRLVHRRQVGRHPSCASGGSR